MADKRTQRVHISMSEGEVAAVDGWRRKQSDIPSRADAIRQLVELGLEAAQQERKIVLRV